MRLAWRNLIHDRLRFLATIVGIAFAVFLMVFQGSLLAGFLSASCKVVNAADADLWIAARGISCVDFPAPLPERLRELAYSIPGIIDVRQLISGVASWQKSDGTRQPVMIVGADPGVGKDFPLPYLSTERIATAPETVLVDASNAATLGILSVPMEVEINQRRAEVASIIYGFGSFIGTPYVFTDTRAGSRYLNLSSEETMFLLVRISPESDVSVVQNHLRERFPEADVWTKEEFAGRSRNFWITQTGAGGTILTAALLGFLIGLVIVSQTIYATTMENIEEFATLKAIGASRGYICRVVLTQALACGLCGSLLGLGATFPLAEVVRGNIPWLYTPWWLPVVMIIASLMMCSMASIISIRKALTIEPGRVFRA